MRAVKAAGAAYASLLLATALAGPVHAAEAATPADPAALKLTPCRLPGLEHDALCGTLKRPLDPAAPQGRSIDLHVAVLPALARQKRPDPVFFFAGGPGQSAIDLAGAIDRMVGRLGARRDIVLVDQRGTGRSAPLQCDAPTPDEAVARGLDPARLEAALAACRQHLQTLPWGDLRQYTTVIAMADVDAVRAALGAQRINLVGVSYGTRAGLEYLRAYPDHVRRAVLDAVAPPDMVLPHSFGVDGTAALDALIADCTAQRACAAAHPDLAAHWQALLAGLPRSITVPDPTDGHPRTVTLTRAAAIGALRPALYIPAMGAAVPFAIDEAAAGRFSPMMAIGTALDGGGRFDLAEGMHFSVVCSEDVPRLPPRAASADAFEDQYRHVCADWPRGTVPAAFYTIPPSPAPVLLLSGSIDPATPPRHAQRVAQALGAKARHVVVPNAGHGTLSLPCVHDAAIRFLDVEDEAEAAKVDLACAARVPRPTFFTPPLPRRAASAPGEVPQ